MHVFSVEKRFLNKRKGMLQHSFYAFSYSVFDGFAIVILIKSFCLSTY